MVSCFFIYLADSTDTAQVVQNDVDIAIQTDIDLDIDVDIDGYRCPAHAHLLRTAVDKTIRAGRRWLYVAIMQKSTAIVYLTTLLLTCKVKIY